jgi:hypothetical protein
MTVLPMSECSSWSIRSYFTSIASVVVSTASNVLALIQGVITSVFTTFCPIITSAGVVRPFKFFSISFPLVNCLDRSFRQATPCTGIGVRDEGYAFNGTWILRLCYPWLDSLPCLSPSVRCALFGHCSCKRTCGGVLLQFLFWWLVWNPIFGFLCSLVLCTLFFFSKLTFLEGYPFLYQMNFGS